MLLKIGLSIAAAGLLLYAFERDAFLHMLVLIGFLLFLVNVAKALASQARKDHRRRHQEHRAHASWSRRPALVTARQNARYQPSKTPPSA